MVDLSGAERLLLKRAGIRDHEAVRAILDSRDAALRHLYETQKHEETFKSFNDGVRRGRDMIERLNDLDPKKIEEDLEASYEEGYEQAKQDTYSDARTEIADGYERAHEDTARALHVEQDHEGAFRWCDQGMCAAVAEDLREQMRKAGTDV